MNRQHSPQERGDDTYEPIHFDRHHNADNVPRPSRSQEPLLYTWSAALYNFVFSALPGKADTEFGFMASDHRQQYLYKTSYRSVKIVQSSVSQTEFQLCRSPDTSISRTAQKHSFAAHNLLASSYLRSYSASHRSHQVALLNRIIAFFKDARQAIHKEQHGQYRKKSLTEVLASQSFSHRYRERQLVYLRACLPLKGFRARGHRSISSVPLLTHLTESDAASRSRRRISWTLKILGAGITAVLALRFVKEQEEQQNSILNDMTYVPFTIVDHLKISPTTSILTLQSHSDQPLSSMPPISSISIKEPNSNIQRPYTVLSSEGNKIKILVKKYEAGELSRYIHSRKQNADLYLRMAPSAYTLPTELPERYLLIMAGTGIVTAFQLLNYLAKSPEGRVPDFTLLYASASKDEVYLQKELAELQAKLGKKLSVEHFVDTEDTFITADRLPTIGADTTTLVCGSDGFVSYIAGPKPEDGQGEVGGLLKQAGVSDNVWKL